MKAAQEIFWRNGELAVCHRKMVLISGAPLKCYVDPSGVSAGSSVRTGGSVGGAVVGSGVSVLVGCTVSEGSGVLVSVHVAVGSGVKEAVAVGGMNRVPVGVGVTVSVGEGSVSGEVGTAVVAAAVNVTEAPGVPVPGEERPGAPRMAASPAQ